MGNNLYIYADYFQNLLDNNETYPLGWIIIAQNADGEYTNMRYADGVSSYEDLTDVDGSNCTKISADYTATYLDDVIMVDASSGDVDVTLPHSLNNRKKLFIIRIDSSGNTVTILAQSGENVEGAASITLAASSYVGLAPDEFEVWYKISEKPTSGGVSDGDKGDITVSSFGTVWTIDNGAVTDAKVATGIDAAKISAGNVSNTEFDYLNGVTSAIQTQIDGKVPTSRTINGQDLSANRTLILKDINVLALAFNPTDGQTIYFGNNPKAPTTNQNQNKIYFRETCTISVAEVYTFAATAGTNENWSMYIRLNNTTDYLVATVGASTQERVFSNTSMSVPIVSGDYIEFKLVNPTWATNPVTVTIGGCFCISN